MSNERAKRIAEAVAEAAAQAVDDTGFGWDGDCGAANNIRALDLDAIIASVPETMDDRYDDGSPHDICKQCGLCAICGDCSCTPNYRRKAMNKQEQALRAALTRLMASDEHIAKATDDDLRGAVDEADIDPIVREQAAAVLQARAALKPTEQPDHSGDWWVAELKKLINICRGEPVTDDMKRAANIAVKFANGETWDAALGEWQPPAKRDAAQAPQNHVNDAVEMVAPQERAAVTDAEILDLSAEHISHVFQPELIEFARALLSLAQSKDKP